MRHHAVTKFYEKLKSHCCKCPSVACMKRIDQKLMDFELKIDGESYRKNSQRKIGIFWKINPKVVSRFNWTPSTRCTIVCVSCRVDCSTFRVDMDKPPRGPTNREKIQKNLPLQCICNNPRPFLFRFPEKSWFWWSRQGVHQYSGFEVLKWSRAMSRCGKMSETRSEVV